MAEVLCALVIFVSLLYQLEQHDLQVELGNELLNIRDYHFTFRCAVQNNQSLAQYSLPTHSPFSIICGDKCHWA